MQLQLAVLPLDTSCQSASHVHDIAGTADLNVPMFIALRRFTLVCTIVLERSLMHKQHDRATLGAVALMIGGKTLLLPNFKLHNLCSSPTYWPQ